MNNSGTHIETLKPPLEEGDNSEVSNIVTSLFSHELSGAGWRKYTKEDLLKLIEQKALELKINFQSPHYILLIRCLQKPKTMAECLSALTNFLLGKGL